MGFLEDSWAVASLRILSDKGIALKLLCTKAKAVPLKTLNIPRLELLSCPLLSTLFSECKLALKRKIKIDKTFVGVILK